MPERTELKKSAREALLTVLPKDSPKDKTIRFRTTKEFRDEVHEVAQATGLSISELFRRLYYSSLRKTG